MLKQVASTRPPRRHGLASSNLSSPDSNQKVTLSRWRLTPLVGPRASCVVAAACRDIYRKGAARGWALPFVSCRALCLSFETTQGCLLVRVLPRRASKPCVGFHGPPEQPTSCLCHSPASSLPFLLVLEILYVNLREGSNISTRL